MGELLAIMIVGVTLIGTVLLAVVVLLPTIIGVARVVRGVVFHFRPRPRCACVCWDAVCRQHPMKPEIIARRPCADAAACPVHGPVVATATVHRRSR